MSGDPNETIADFKAAVLDATACPNAHDLTDADWVAIYSLRQSIKGNWSRRRATYYALSYGYCSGCGAEEWSLCCCPRIE